METYQVHAIPSRSDQTSIRQRIHRRQLIHRHTLVQVMNRHVLDRAKSPIDPAHELVDARAEVLVLFDILARGDRELDEDDLADPLGVLREEDFKGLQFLRDALDVIEAVDTDHDLY